MTYIETIKRKDKEYYYLTKNVRISLNKWKKIRIYIGDVKPSKEEVAKAFLQPRCVSQTELTFCSLMKDFNSRKEYEGIYIFADTLFIFYDLMNTVKHFETNQKYS